MANNAVRWIAPVLLGALMLLFPADGLRALGLGEARVDSWLGQPLDISIRLIDVQSQAVESVSVAPASLEDYERLGVPSDSLGLGLEATVDRSTDPVTVRVRSQRPVDDPVVQILIDARWSSGRVLREYTLFLDPPVMDSAPPVRDVSQPATEPASEPVSEPVSATDPAPAERQEREMADRADEPATQPASRPSQPAEDSATTAPRSGDSVRVSRGDTLWGIAQDWRPDRSLSMDQVMLAIFNRNRGAFLGENINRLRSDALLDMPGIDEVQTVDRAEAERRVREHMRSWQPQVAEDVPVVSDAATPEMPEPSAEADQEETAPEEGIAETAESDEEYRLDVVPPEEDRYSETSAVAESEISRVSEQLAEVEEEIAASGVENERFDDHIAEVRGALEQRDMAGVAVAEESLAELQARLREAREVRAEQDGLAQTADDGEAAVSEEDDQVSDYMRELEEEFGTQEGEEPTAESEEMAATDEGEAIAAADESSGADSREADDAGQTEEADSSMPVTRNSDGITGWLWPAVGLLVLVVIVVGALLWLRRRRQASEMSETSSTAGDPVDSARASVARKPGDLAAHLTLLKLLADRGREQEFTDAFDQMYQQVDDETEPEWQEALSLASAHVPDHPLLTPHEEPEDEAFDRRADEMIGMLDMGEADSESDTDTEEFDSAETGDEEFDLGMEDDTTEPVSSETEDDSGDAGKEETFDEDMDLAVLSERLDDPDSDTGSTTSVPADAEETDFGEFEEDDEDAGADTTAENTDEHSEAPVEFEDEDSAGPDLDFTPAREQEADEVLGEAGAREDEDLDLELSSDVEDIDSTASDEGLDFDLGETDETDETESEASGPVEEPEAEESADKGEEESPEQAGGSLGDEDADVKLDLARAYISVDLADSARPVLEEVISDGSEEKRAEAQKLLDDLS